MYDGNKIRKIVHHKKVYPHHKWRLNEEGKPDEWAFEYGYHNGYSCQRCGYCFCINCDPDGFDKEPCVVEYNTCPYCNEEIFNYKNIFYCYKCGGKIDGGD